MIRCCFIILKLSIDQRMIYGYTGLLGIGFYRISCLIAEKYFYSADNVFQPDMCVSENIVRAEKLVNSLIFSGDIPAPLSVTLI